MDKPILDRVKQRVREHGETYKINELCLDDLPLVQITPEIAKFLEKCINLEYITFQNCNLKSLANLPKMPKLEIIEIANNQIQGSSLNILAKFNNLRSINLENNKIDSFDQLKHLQSCRQLGKIYLQGNPICGEGYRAHVFSILPQLETVDGFNRLGQVVAEQFSSEGSSDYSESEIEDSEGEQERESPTKMKRKN